MCTKAKILCMNCSWTRSNVTPPSSSFSNFPDSDHANLETTRQQQDGRQITNRGYVIQMHLPADRNLFMLLPTRLFLVPPYTFAPNPACKTTKTVFLICYLSNIISTSKFCISPDFLLTNFACKYRECHINSGYNL